MSNCDSSDVSETGNRISTFAVIDLETCSLPAYTYNKTSITELCIYGFAANKLTRSKPTSPNENVAHEIPQTPRVVHKLNMLFCPNMPVQPVAEEITGLDNYILECENTLDENAGKTIIGFLQHLPQPVCLVAHNGLKFDFPIVKKSLDKIGLSLPLEILCVDSLQAFKAIDEVLKDLQEDIFVPNGTSTEATVKSECNIESNNGNSHLPELNDVEQKKMNKETDWRTVNETTPRRPTLPSDKAPKKRKQLFGGAVTPLGNDNQESLATKRLCTLKSRRALFTEKPSAKTKHSPRGFYKLTSIYERIFAQPASSAHQAEADVSMLTKLIQHYGIDFLAFAESQAIPFKEVNTGFLR